MKLLKDHRGFLLGFGFTLLVFLFPIITMRSGFIYGDSFVQFFPWFKAYSVAIKNFSFPFWIRQIQSGFPLMAEGQTGGFYPLNIILFFVLPFKIAYNYSVILHFIIAGIFTYLYSRKIGANQEGGFLAALLFCFGSNYAGCFLNIVSLRTLAWFPAVLYLFEIYFVNKKPWFLFISGIILGCQILAGFVQMAAYSVIFYTVYFLFKVKQEKEHLNKILSFVFLVLFPAIIIALPQLLLTLQLSKFSIRGELTLGFALWRSFSPLSLLSIFFPFSFLFSPGTLYIGVLSIFFVIHSLFLIKVDSNIRNLFLMLILAIFLSLGQFNPLYVLFLKITKFYSLRSPFKFLFFALFPLSVLAGISFTNFFAHKSDEVDKKTVSFYRLGLMVSGVSFILLSFLMHIFRNQILSVGEAAVKMFILNKPYHRMSPEYYQYKFVSLYQAIIKGLSFLNVFTLISWFLVSIGLFFTSFLIKRRCKVVVIIIIFIDLFIFSFYGAGFRGNIRDFKTIEPSCKHILQILQQDKEIFRILPLDIALRKVPAWTWPNANILYDIDSVACYTPLADNNYRKKLSGLEIVDDSLGFSPTTPGAIDDNFLSLRLLNVKYVISTYRLKQEYLEYIETEDGVFLYKLKGYLPRVFFTESIAGNLQLQAIDEFQVEKYDNGIVKIRILTQKDGFVVFSESFYPGWQAMVDDTKVNIYKVGDLVQAVAVSKGKHSITFEYRPFSFK
jgi:hypothetical protein